MTEGATSIIETVTNSLTTGLQDIATGAGNAIAAALPIALPIMGALVVVAIGIKIFKKVTNK